MQPVFIHTGNLLGVSQLKRKPGQTPADELFDALTIILKKESNTNKVNDGIISKGLPDKLNPTERANQKITAKLFLSSITEDAVNNALKQVLNELGVSSVDLLLLSWPSSLADPTSETAKDFWAQVEEAVSSGKVVSVGVSDMDHQQFTTLYSSAAVKPEAVQINLEVCCVVPPELATFTRENNIQLLTHNDPQDILTSEKLAEIDLSIGKLHWVVRYQTMWRCRGILENKGYIIKAETNE